MHFRDHIKISIITDWLAVHITLRSILFGIHGLQTKLMLIITAVILVLFSGYHGYTCPHNNRLVNIQELLLLLNLTIMYAVSYQSNESVFSVVTNFMISLAFFQFCTIVLYHFLTYTCHWDFAIVLQTGKQKMLKYFRRSNISQENHYQHELLDIPTRTYNYTEYQDGLISDDFK